jgi:predicted ATP-grasp superfamily ATP-dependent carboligase
VRNPEELSVAFSTARAEGWSGDMILQPFVAGQPASVAFLVGPGGPLALAPAAQDLSSDGRFHYRGGWLPLPPHLGERAVRLARPAIEVISGLRGFVGVDLVLGDAPDGSEDWVIEINPRLTTSYLGLRALAETNLAELMLRIVQGKQVTPPRWRSDRVEFRLHG